MSRPCVGTATRRLQPAESDRAGYVTNIERDTLDDEDYRRVLFTGPNTQLMLVTLRPARHEIADGSAVVISSGPGTTR